MGEGGALAQVRDTLCAASMSVILGFVVLGSLVVVDIGCAIALWCARMARLARTTRVAWRSFFLRGWMRLIIGILELYGSVTMVVSGEKFRRKEAALVVANHRSWLDTIAMYALSRQVGMDGDLKFLAKSSLLLFPVFGFAGGLLEAVIFIKRSATSAGATLERTYETLVDPERKGYPFWLISYLEGTRRTRAKLAASADFAKRRDLAVLEHVLQPRTKGFVTSIAALRGNVTAVYDITLGYQETKTAERDVEPSFMRTLLTPGWTPRPVHVYQKRIPIEDVPEDEEELKAWVYKLYEEKDKLLAEFAATGKFPGESIPWKRTEVGDYAVRSVVFWGAFVGIVYAFRALRGAVVG